MVIEESECRLQFTFQLTCMLFLFHKRIKGMLEKKIYTINVECDISLDMLDNIFPGLNDAKIIVTLGSVGRRLLSWRVGNHFDVAVRVEAAEIE